MTQNLKFNFFLFTALALLFFNTNCENSLTAESSSNEFEEMNWSDEDGLYEEEKNYFSRNERPQERKLFFRKWFDNLKNIEKLKSQTYQVSQNWLVDQLDYKYADFINPGMARAQILITTDKEIYRPNDVMFIQIIIVDAFNKTPVAMYYEEQKYYYDYYNSIKVIDPSESTINSSYGYLQNTSTTYTYKLEENCTGGQYKLEAYIYGFARATKIVRVQDYPRPQLEVVISLDQDSYFPGSTVNGKITASNIDGSVFQESPTFSYSATFNETVRSEQEQTMSLRGIGYFSFLIPNDTSLLYSTIGFTVQAGSIVEAASKVLVISNPDQITIDFSPETGNFVSEVNNKVYFAAYINEYRYDIVDFSEATLIQTDLYGNSIAVVEDIATSHKGKGVFEFTPGFLVTNFYALKVPIPNSSKVIYRQLPTMTHIQNEVNFRIGNHNKVLRNNEDLKVEIFPNYFASSDDIYILTVAVKERILYSEQFQFYEEMEPVQMLIKDNYINLDNGGVVQVSVYKLSEQVISYSLYQDAYQRDEDSVINSDPSPYFKKETSQYTQQIQAESNSDHDGRKLSDLLKDDERRQLNIKASSEKPNVHEWRIPRGEILIFYEPKEKLSLSVSTSKEVYVPGELVEFEVTISGNSGEEENLVSVVVTDDTVFSRLEEKLQPPSFGSALYLKYDVLNDDHHFNYPNYYLEHIFGDKHTEYSSNENLELLLGIQHWRRNIFDLDYLDYLVNNTYSITNEEKNKINTLFGMNFLYETSSYSFYYDSADLSTFNTSSVSIAEESSATMFDSASMDDSASRSSSNQGASSEGSSSTSTTPSGPAFDQSLNLTELPSDFMVNIPPNTALWAHQRRVGYDESLRIDKTETQFYSALTSIGKSRTYKGSFYLSDLITDFRITANAIDTKGRIGYTQSALQTQLPFYISFELPPSMTNGDALEIPVTVKNLGNETMTFTLTSQTSSEIQASIADGRNRQIESQASDVVKILVTAKATTGQASMLVTGKATGSSSGIQREDNYISYTAIGAQGFPQSDNFGGFISTTFNQNDIASSVSHSITLPDQLESNTFEFEAKVMTTNLALLLEAVSALIRKPYGCFEQTSSTTYPMVMGLNFLSTLNDQSDEVEEMKFQILTLLKPGYKRLVSFQSKEGGYDWFGDSPPNEALTAYGVLQFTDMQKVTDFVDSNMVKQAIDWLLSRKNSNGGFDLQDDYHSFGSGSNEIVFAYIIWALVEAGYQSSIEEQINYMTTYTDASIDNGASGDPYILSLMSVALYKLGDTDRAQRYADVLQGKQETYGGVEGAKASITYSWNNNLVIETTALSTIAWLNDIPKYQTNIQSAIKWIVSKMKKGGSYGSTQATILSLKALTKYMEEFQSIQGQGDMVLSVNGKEVERLSFTGAPSESLHFDLSAYVENNPKIFEAGDRIKFTLAIENFETNSTEGGDFQASYSMEATYMDKQPPVLESDLNVNVKRLFPKSELGSVDAIGKSFDYEMTIENDNAEDQTGMVVGIFRLPSCLEVNYELLDTLMGNGVMDMYEVQDYGSEVVLYFTQFDQLQSRQINLSFIQAFEGECYERPHNAYKYYDDDEYVIWCGTV